MHKLLSAAGILMVMLLCLPGVLTAQADNVLPALHQGERLVYDIRWGIFPAGEAVLDVRHVDDPERGKLYEIELRAQTRGLFRAVYPLEVLIRSLLSEDLQRSLAFYKNQNGRETRIAFNWEAGTAQYSSNGGVREPIELPDNALDPLALLVVARTQNQEVGSSLQGYFTDGKRSVAGAARVVDEKRLQTPWGTVDTVMVKPTLTGVGGVFSRSRNPSLTIWFTRDQRRLPVRITSKITLGHLTGELVEVEAL